MRALTVFARLLPFVLAFLWDRRRFLVFGRPRRRDEESHRRRAVRLVATLAELGPTFIKLAQVLAARSRSDSSTASAPSSSSSGTSRRASSAAGMP